MDYSMRSSKSLSSSVKTLIGNGWLRESPKNLWPRGWDIKSRSALRKCVFLPIPPEAAEFIRNLPPPKPSSPADLRGLVIPIQSAARVATPAPRSVDPNKKARAFEAISPDQVAAQQRQRMLADARRAAMGKKPLAPLAPANDTQHAQTPRAWHEDPIVIGTLLFLMPPAGLAAIWTSKRYSNDARWALTVMTGLMMCLFSAVIIAAIALQSH